MHHIFPRMLLKINQYECADRFHHEFSCNIEMSIFLELKFRNEFFIFKRKYFTIWNFNYSASLKTLKETFLSLLFISRFFINFLISSFQSPQVLSFLFFFFFFHSEIVNTIFYYCLNFFDKSIFISIFVQFISYKLHYFIVWRLMN